jgi:hypothetical protein
MPVTLREVPGSLPEMPVTLREVPGLPFRAGRHLTAWIRWQTDRISMIEDLGNPQPPNHAIGRD